MARKKKTPKAQRQKLTKQRTKLDWLHAGEDILREKGFVGLRLAALTQRLGVSTGSFYHHYRDFDDFLALLAEHFDGAELIRIMEEASKGGKGPLTRLDNLMTISMRSGLYALDGAMRDWAVTDKRAKASLDRASKMVLSYYIDAFRDMGFGKADAALRGQMLLGIKVAYGHDKDFNDRKFHKLVLDVLTLGANKSKLK